MNILILLVLLGPGLAVAQYEEDVQCESEEGVCQYNNETCNGTYELGKCGGPIDRQCCLENANPLRYSLQLPPYGHVITQCKQGDFCQSLGEKCQDIWNPNLKCSGKYRPKMCPEPGHCQCCLRCQEDERCKKVGGSCQYNNYKCHGIYKPQMCPGGKNCQCCVPKWKPFCHGQVVNVVRGCEGKYGCGHYKSPRPHGKHMGVDIICPDGSRVNAPFKGELKGWARAYKKNNAINDGVILSNSVFCIKIFYVHAHRYTGAVNSDQAIGYLLNVQRVYPGITSHIHVEMCDKSKDPTFYLN
ncbi:uncharacterized protein LOC116942813 [Petromyzon marinus]